jgi:hypothetical protein
MSLAEGPCSTAAIRTVQKTLSKNPGTLHRGFCMRHVAVFFYRCGHNGAASPLAASSSFSRPLPIRVISSRACSSLKPYFSARYRTS